jgi:pimeloyl-ACP methyl ester carboxylesterase
VKTPDWGPVWEDGFVDLAAGSIHYRIHRSDSSRASLVFLHEGLGSVGLWRSFPADVLAAVGDRTVLVYSRHGYGESAVVGISRTPEFMHFEAQFVLPQLLSHFQFVDPVLIGHSDGASIALIHAASGGLCSGLVLLAPHVFVEMQSIDGIRAAKVAFETTDLPARMAKHHMDAEVTFRGWNNIWLSPEFADWNLVPLLKNVCVPILLIQGDEDEYGTTAQLDAIQQNVTGPADRTMLPGVRHSPHLESSDACIASIRSFLSDLESRADGP